MRYEYVNPREGIPATLEEKTFMKGRAGATFSTVYFPVENTPVMFHLDNVTDINGVKTFAFPEFRIFDTSKGNLRGFNHNEVQWHLKHHMIEDTHIIHWLLCCRDRWPDPYITETTINPSDSPGILSLLSESPFVVLNLYLNCEYYETRMIDNTMRENAREILNIIEGMEHQTKDRFMISKRELENSIPFKYSSFVWDKPIKTIKLNFA